MNSTEKFEYDVFQRIINRIIFDSGFLDNSGLLNGKMGQTIFFAALYDQTGDIFYGNITKRLIDEVYSDISVTTTSDFENGLAGIGWGIEYLVQNGFFNANTDDVLAGIDCKVKFAIENETKNIGLLTGFSGYCFYLIKRIQNNTNNRSEKTHKSLKQSLKSAIRNIELIILDDRHIFYEPDEFDVCFDPLVLLLLCQELMRIKGFDKSISMIQEKIRKTEFRSKIYLLLRDKLLQVCHSNKSALFTLVNGLLSEVRINSLSKLTIRNGFPGFLFILYVFAGKNLISVFGSNEITRVTKWIKEESGKALTLLSNKSGFLEGFCGFGFVLLYKIHTNPVGFNKIIKNRNSIIRHIQPGSQRINLFFFPNLYSGAGTYSQEMIAFLKERPEIKLQIVDILPNERDFKITLIKEYVHIIIPIDSKYHTNGRFQNFTIEIANNFFYRIIEILNRNFLIQDSIFHFNHSTDFNLLIEMLKNRFNTKNVLTWHFIGEDHTLEEIGKNPRPSNENKYIKPYGLDKIICVSYFEQRVLIRHYGIKNEQTKVIWNGTSSWFSNNLDIKARISLRKKIGLPESKRVILFSGKLEPRKGVEELISAFIKLCESHHDLHLVLAGDGDFSSYLPMCFGYYDSITFTGRLSHYELQSFYQLADIGVVPSRWEVFGYVPIEMMHSGLPVLGSKVPGMNEILEHFSNPDELFHVKVESNSLKVDTESIIKTLSLLLNNSERLKEIAQRGLLCAQNVFSRDRMGKQTVELYNYLLDFS